MDQCGSCGQRGGGISLKRCSRCKMIRYCSVTCQSRDWPRHKVTCRESSVGGPLSPTTTTTTTGIPDTSAPTSSTPQRSTTTTTTNTTTPTTTTATTNTITPTSTTATTITSITTATTTTITTTTTTTTPTTTSTTNTTTPTTTTATTNTSTTTATTTTNTSTTNPSSWEQARSRAQEAFPGNKVADDLSGDLDYIVEDQQTELDAPASPRFMDPLLRGESSAFQTPFFFPLQPGFEPPRVVRISQKSRRVLLLRLEAELPAKPGQRAWLASDCKTGSLQVRFEMDDPLTHFRFSDLQPGHFLCIRQPTLNNLIREKVRYIGLKDASQVRVFRI